MRWYTNILTAEFAVFSLMVVLLAAIVAVVLIGFTVPTMLACMIAVAVGVAGELALAAWFIWPKTPRA